MDRKRFAINELMNICFKVQITSIMKINNQLLKDNYPNQIKIKVINNNIQNNIKIKVNIEKKMIKITKIIKKILNI